MNYYRIFEQKRNEFRAHPSAIAPDFTEYNIPAIGKRKSCTHAVWCNLMEENIDEFRRAEEDGTKITMSVYEGDINVEHGLRRLYTIGNLPECEADGCVVIPLSDIGY